MSPDDLRARQRALLDALAEPLTGASRARAGLPPGAGAPAEGVARAAAWLAPSATLDAAARLEIYRRQYWLRVLGALADDFPALRWLLGPATFAALAERYLIAHPPAPRRSTPTSWRSSRSRGCARSPLATARRCPPPSSARRRWRWRRT